MGRQGPAGRRCLWRGLGLGVLLVLVGCGGAEDRPARWSFIAPAIIEPSCATVSCHSAVAQRAGVVLDSRETAYKTLTTRHFVVTCASDAGATCVENAAATSEIVVLMRGQGSRRMPPDFALPEADIRLIEKWISNGARDD
jgi:hypothetical protein